MKWTIACLGLCMAAYAVGRSSANESEGLVWQGGFYEGLGGAIEGDNAKDKVFKVRFASVKYGAFIAVYGERSAVIDVWIDGPHGAARRHEQFLPAKQIDGSAWTSGVIKLYPQQRGDEYTITVKTNSDAFVFTDHQLVPM